MYLYNTLCVGGVFVIILIFALLTIFLNKFLSSPTPPPPSVIAPAPINKKVNDENLIETNKQQSIRIATMEECGVGWKYNMNLQKCVRDFKIPNPIDENFQDFSVSPCENFYQYSCGRFASDYHNYQTDVSFNFLYDLSRNKSLELLQEVIQNPSDSDNNKIATFYNTCVSSRKTEVISPAISMLIQSVETSVSSKEDLVKLWGKLQIFDTILPLQLIFNINPTNTREIIPILALSGLFVENQFQISSKQHLNQIINRLSLIYTKEQAISLAADIVSIENSLWSIRSATIGPTNLVTYFNQGEFDKNFFMNWQTVLKYPLLDIPTFIENACPPSVSLDKWRLAFSKRGIWCQSSDFFPKLSSVLSKYSMASWIAYTKYAILFHKYNELSLEIPDNVAVTTEVQQLLDQQYFYRKHYDPNYNFPWDYPRVFNIESLDGSMFPTNPTNNNGLCLALTDNYFKFILDRYFISSLYDSQIERAIQLMFDDIKGFYNYYATFPYLKEQEKAILLEKLNQITINIMHPQRWGLDSVPLVLNEDSYVDSVIGIRKYHVLQSYCFFVDHVIDRQEFRGSYEFTGLTKYANAAYLHQFNTIKIDASLLQLPIFSPAIDAQFHYSRIVWILAHEIAHSIDKTGIYFDAQGSVDIKQISLPAKYEMMKRINCFEGESSATSNEDMSDVNGLIISYEMMKNHTGRTLNLDEMQSFFISYAQLHCSAFKEIDKHYSLAFNRVNDVVKQVPDFEKSFNCQKSITNKCNIFF